MIGYFIHHQVMSSFQIHFCNNIFSTIIVAVYLSMKPVDELNIIFLGIKQGIVMCKFNRGAIKYPLIFSDLSTQFIVCPYITYHI